MLTRVVSLNAAADGPLKTSANGRYFVDQTGKPFFWLGDTAWSFFTRCSMPQAEHYLKARSEMGFAVIQAVLIYLASQCSFFVHLDKIAAGETRATWINPVTGERKDAGTYPTGNRDGKGWPAWRIQSFTVPFHWEDALLLLESI